MNLNSAFSVDEVAGFAADATADQMAPEPKWSQKQAHEMHACNRAAECQMAVESDHRIANHMAMLAGYIRLRRGEFAKVLVAQDRREVLRMFDGIGAQVAAVAELHRMLTVSASSTSGDISSQLERICAAFRKGPACDTLIEYHGEPGCVLPMRHILPVSQIVAEVMTNALKYGHKSGFVGSIRIGCRREVDGQIVISVDDDGSGLQPDTSTDTKPEGIGGSMVATLASRVNGVISHDRSDRGLSVKLCLPSMWPAASAVAPNLGQHVGASL